MAHILILIVDDDPTLRDQYATILRKRGYIVHEARDASEGLDMLSTQSPKVLILDEFMPGSDGMAFLEAADIPHQHPGVKVLVATNVDDQEMVERMKGLGVDRQIVKSESSPHQVADLVDEMTGT